MVRQSISLIEPNAEWVKSLIDAKEYTSMSDALNDLVRQARRQEAEKAQALQAMLMEAEQSIQQQGHSQRSLNEIWEVAKQKYSANNG